MGRGSVRPLAQTGDKEHRPLLRPLGHRLASEAAFCILLPAADDVTEQDVGQRAELAATLESLVDTPPAKADDAVACRFPARAAWLRQQLNITENDLPSANCPAFSTWLKGINPHEATLVFAAYFVN